MIIWTDADYVSIGPWATQLGKIWKQSNFSQYYAFKYIFRFQNFGYFERTEMCQALCIIVIYWEILQMGKEDFNPGFHIWSESRRKLL